MGCCENGIMACLKRREEKMMLNDSLLGLKFSMCLLFVVVIALLTASLVKQRRRYEEQVRRLERIEAYVKELKARVWAEGGENGIRD